MKRLILLLLLAAKPVFASPIILTEKNTVVFRGEVTPQSVAAAQMDLANQHIRRGWRSYPIYVVLDSPGGSVEAGFQFIEFAKMIPNVETITMFAASMGSAIVNGLPGKRHILSTGTLMFHRARTQIEGQISNGKLESRLRMTRRLVSIFEAINYTRMQTTKEWYQNAIKDELWFVGDEAIQYKAADDVTEVVCDMDLLRNKKTIVKRGIFADYKVTVSRCPLITGPIGSEEL